MKDNKKVILKGKNKEGRFVKGHKLNIGKLNGMYNRPVLQSIALLHDVVEDSDITLADLEKEGIPKIVIEGVNCLTKRPDEKYLDYILRVKEFDCATLVKIEDIKHNYPTSHKSKQERYDMALYILKGGK